MDQTEKYLNDILKKRLGSVVNYGASSKTATTVTRLPKKEEKVQNMPTVFRKKHQTVYHQQQIPYQFQSEQFSQRQSNNGGIKSNYSGRYNSVENDLANEEKKPMSNQRVEYMLISKRIQQKTQDNFISPTVDVTKYNQNSSSKQIIPALSSKINSVKQKNETVQNSSNKLIIQQSSRSSKNVFSRQSEINKIQQNFSKYEEQQQGYKKHYNYQKEDLRSLNSQGQSQQKSKRKKIFN